MRSCRDPQHVVAGTHRGGLWSAGRGHLAGRVGRNGRNKTEQGRRSGDVRRGRSVLAVMILEGMNYLDDSQKTATIRSDIVPKLPLPTTKLIPSELSARPGLEASTFPGARRVNLFPHDPVLIRCFTFFALKFKRGRIGRIQSPIWNVHNSTG
jgi:hypothetical protein